MTKPIVDGLEDDLKGQASVLRLDLTSKVGRAAAREYGVKVVPAIDIFNLMNGNTTLSIRGTQNASNANTISSLLAPRVFRFGARVTW